jgi:uncharacterized protein (TIGR02145 family)
LVIFKGYFLIKSKINAMKEVICLIVLLQVGSMISAQDLTISFQPKISGNPIDSIRATNLRTNQFVKLIGGESLVLVKTPTGMHPVSEPNETGYIYPNPAAEDATFCFSTNKSQEVEIRLHNANGQLLKQNRLFLEQGMHRFELKFPVAGIYYLSVQKSDGLASFKAIYTGRKIQNSSIQFEGSEKFNSEKSDANQLKHATIGITLNYVDGDVIQYSFFSGMNITIVSDTPTTSETIEVEFVNCIDNNGKSYKVVQIGSQWWMAENLAWLPTVSPFSADSRSSPFYYIYGYEGINVSEAMESDNYNTYGVLYNWVAAVTACPQGWKLPSDEDWKTLEKFLLMSSLDAEKFWWRYSGAVGGKLKEKGNAHWWDPNFGATNECGFTALPGGFRDIDGFFGLGFQAMFWSSSESEHTSYTWDRILGHKDDGVGRYSHQKNIGMSVRCLCGK